MYAADGEVAVTTKATNSRLGKGLLVVGLLLGGCTLVAAGLIGWSTYQYFKLPSYENTLALNTKIQPAQNAQKISARKFLFPKPRGGENGDFEHEFYTKKPAVPKDMSPTLQDAHMRESKVFKQCPGDSNFASHLPLEYAVVEITTEELRFAGEPIITLEQGGLWEEHMPATGRVITELYDSCLWAVELQKDWANRFLGHGCWRGMGKAGGRFRGHILIAVEPAVPFGVLRHTLFTAQDSQFSKISFLVDDPGAVSLPPAASDEAGLTPKTGTVSRAKSGKRAITPEELRERREREEYLGLSPAKATPSCIDAVVSLTPSGFEVKSSDHQLLTTIPCAGGNPCTTSEGFDLAQLNEKLEALRKKNPLWKTLLIHPSDDIPSGLVLATLDTSRPHFSEVQLIGNPDSDYSNHRPNTTSISIKVSKTPNKKPKTEKQVTPSFSSALSNVKHTTSSAPKLTMDSALSIIQSRVSTTPIACSDQPDTESSDQSLLEGIFKRHLSGISYCYRRELSKVPSLAGSMKVQFDIETNGDVSNAEVKSSTLDNREVELCVVGRVKRMQFTKSLAATGVVVPFVFGD